MYTPVIPTTKRDLSDPTSANVFLDEMAELILAHHVNVPPTIHRDTDRFSMLVDWSDHMGPRCAQIEIQIDNGFMGSLWLVNATRKDGTVGYASLSSHVGIAVGQLFVNFGMG